MWFRMKKTPADNQPQKTDYQFAIDWYIASFFRNYFLKFLLFTYLLFSLLFYNTLFSITREMYIEKMNKIDFRSE